MVGGVPVMTGYHRFCYLGEVLHHTAKTAGNQTLKSAKNVDLLYISI